MRAVLGQRSVDVVQVGRLQSKVTYYDAGVGETLKMWVHNFKLAPEPCGACLGQGCAPCEQRGHSPRKNKAVAAFGMSLGKLSLVHVAALALARLGPRAEREILEAGECPRCRLEAHEGDCR